MALNTGCTTGLRTGHRTWNVIKEQPLPTTVPLCKQMQLTEKIALLRGIALIHNTYGAFLEVTLCWSENPTCLALLLGTMRFRMCKAHCITPSHLRQSLPVAAWHSREPW